MPPACVLLIFLLSFFTWHVTESTTPVSLWGLFWYQQSGIFIAYTILLLPCLPLSFAAMVIDKGWVILPPPLALLMTFKNLLELRIGGNGLSPEVIARLSAALPNCFVVAE